MKIAIPTKDNSVDDHFGNSEFYTVFDVNNDKTVITKSSFTAPEGCGCKSGLASILKEMQVDILLAGNIGQGAMNKLNAEGISVVRGCKGNVEEVVKAYLSGFVIDSGETCSEHGHMCNH